MQYQHRLLRSMGVCNNQHCVIWTRLGVLFECWSWKILCTFEHTHIALCNAIWVFRIWTYTRPIELIFNSTVYRWEYRLSAMYVTLYCILFSCVILLASGHATETEYAIDSHSEKERGGMGLTTNDKEKVLRIQMHHKQQNIFLMEMERKKCSSIVLFAILCKT